MERFSLRFQCQRTKRATSPGDLAKTGNSNICPDQYAIHTDRLPNDLIYAARQACQRMEDQSRGTAALSARFEALERTMPWPAQSASVP